MGIDVFTGIKPSRYYRDYSKGMVYSRKLKAGVGRPVPAAGSKFVGVKQNFLTECNSENLGGSVREK
jgi:hypothetical protein